MTDLLLRHRKVGLMSRLSAALRYQPSKQPHAAYQWGDLCGSLGELLASMHLFGSLNYVNSLGQIADNVSLVVRSILLKLSVDETGSNVHVIHEGGSLSIGRALEHLSNSLKK